MKDKFPGHFATAKSDPNLWKNCIFIFDTNILLNLYRYSDETRTLFLKTLERLKERIWIPYRVASEYLENRLNVIYEQQEEYEKAIIEINKLKGKLENSRQHPFVSTDTMKEVGASLDKAISELNNNKKAHSNRINSDEIKDSIADLFEGRVGDSSSDARLEEIITDGAERYKQKIPPGYSDIKKQNSEDSLTARCRPYGDLIIWKSILEKAKQLNSPIIFVTDDGKEDWWLRFKGKTLGPRPELIEEFKNQVNQDFHMYLPERFLSFASNEAQNKPSKEMLDEIIDIRKKEQTASNEAEPSILSIAQKRNELLNTEHIKHVSFNKTKFKNHTKNTTWHDKLKSTQTEINELSSHIDYMAKRAEEIRQQAINFVRNYAGDSRNLESEEEYLNLKAEHEIIMSDINFFKGQREHLIRKISYLDDGNLGWPEA